MEKCRRIWFQIRVQFKQPTFRVQVQQFNSQWLQHAKPDLNHIMHLAYTGCPRRNGQNFGRVFLMLNYTDITQNICPKLNGYGDNGQRSLKLWQLLHTYWLPNTYWKWQEYVVSVMLISVLNIEVTCECHKDIKLNYKNTRTTVVFVLRFPSNLHRPQLFVISPRSLHCDVS